MSDPPAFTLGQPQLLRAMNERQALEHVRRLGPVSRASIARATGLSKPTVSLALAHLELSGLVRSVGRSSGSKGPRARLYELNPNSGWVMGIDVGRHWVRAAVADMCGQIVARHDERSKASSSRALIAQIGALAHRTAAEAGVPDWRQVTHTTVGGPGVFDPRLGMLEHAPNLPGWDRRGLAEAIRLQLGTDVTFENDVNLAALAESARGLGRGVDCFAYLWIGTGVGLGIVIDGKVYRGASGAAGEIGYLPLHAEGEAAPCHTKQGCFEAGVNAHAVVRRARDAGLRVATPKAVFTAARRGDPRAVEVVDGLARRIALSLAIVSSVLDPGLVVLGGGIGANGDLLLEPIDRELQALGPFRPRLATSELGDEAVLEGAVATALAAAQDTLFARAKRSEEPLPTLQESP